MRSQPTLLRVLTPPPVGPSNLLLQGAATTESSISEQALALNLARASPFSPPRTSPFTLHLNTVHPCEPLVTYLVVPEGNERNKLPKTIVVQHVQTKEVVYSVTLGDLASTLFQYDVVSSDEGMMAKQQKILKDQMGQVRRLEFFDPSTLYWSGHGSIAGPQDVDQRWKYLLVQFERRLLIVNLRQKSVSVAKNPKPDPSNCFSPIMANVNSASLGCSHSSNSLPVSSDTILVATTDGSLKLYNWRTSKVVKAVQAISGGNKDMIVEIISANKYETPEKYAQKLKRRILGLTKKGIALLIEMTVVDGMVQDLAAPLAKFEGGGIIPDADESSSMEHIYIQYCAYRNLLSWNYPSKNARGKLLVWNLNDVPETSSNRSGPMPYEPTLVMQFPFEMTHTIFPGWLNECIPMECMACAALTKEGDFQILVAPLYNSGSSTRNPYSAYPIFGVSLHQILYRDLLLSEDQEIQVKFLTVFCPPLRDTSTFYLGTTLGILMLKMADGNLVQNPGTKHAHLNANFGGLGKAVLSVKGPEISYGILEPPSGPLAMDPIGAMEIKNTVSLYKSPPPLHLPPELHKRPVRLPPIFLMSPSRSFLCCFWKEEMRYEVFHIPSMLEKVTSRVSSAKSPVVASGNGVASFAWVGDSDVFSLLYNPEADLALKVGFDLSSTQSLGKELLGDLAKLREMNKLKTSGKKLGKISKLQSLKGLQEIGKGTMKSIKMTGMATAELAAGTVKQTGMLTKGFKAARFFGKKSKTKDQDGSLATADEEEDARTFSTAQTPIEIVGGSSVASSTGVDLERKYPWVELRTLAVPSDSDVSNVTAVGLGELSLRSGNRNPPTVLFGGPVLCVASKTDENDEGLAYFYTKKKGSVEESASEYTSSGPAFPCPDLVVWDDDGRLCAVTIQSTASIYLSEEPEFVMLGTVKVGTPSDLEGQVISARFIHGALYVTTRSAIQVIFLGDLDGGICHLDLYTLACSDVFTLPSKSIVTDHTSLTPHTIPMPLNYPTILGYQNSALMISTVSGVQAVPLSSPLLRIGALLGAGHPQKAEKWFDAVSLTDHETLAKFLERRGAPDMALSLSGISLETVVDISMRYGYVDRLEEMAEQHGFNGLRAIDMSHGLSTNIFRHTGTSVVVCVSAYLLSQGKVELVRRLATECLGSGDEGKREAFTIASLLMSLDSNDAMRVMQRAVQDEHPDSDWLVGKFVRENILKPV